MAKRRGLFIGLAALALAPPAAASDAAELACPTDAITAAERSRIDEAIGRGDHRAPETRDVVDRGIEACAGRFDWTAEERDDAAQYVHASLALAVYRRRLEGQDLDIARLERELLADEALIGAAVERRSNPPELAAYFNRMRALVEPWAIRHAGNRDMLAALGGFIATRAIAEGSRIRFSRR